MLKIGEFSTAAKVSIKTLRYYDQMGLLKPAWKDRFTGYRFYHHNQIEDLNRILALKELGFSLEQVQTILLDEITIPQLKTMLRLKQSELKQEIEDNMAQLALIEDRLRQMENGAGLEQITTVQKPTRPDQIERIKELDQMNVEIKTVPAFTAAGMKYIGKNENQEIAAMWQKIVPRWGEIKNPSKPYEVAYGICGEMQEDGAFSYLASIKVDKVEDLPTDMDSWDIPEQTYAVFPCTLAEIHQTYEFAHGTWMPENGYKRAVGPDFEYYDMSFDPAVPGSIFYVYIPIKK
jgi:predicted transcriptional regulator YdeE